MILAFVLPLSKVKPVVSSNIVIGAEVAPFQTYDSVYDLSFVTYVPSFVLNKRCV